MSTPAVRFQHVSIVFGPNPGKALALMDAGKSRDDIKRATGQVLGVHDCSLDVGTGEIVVLMGLSGSGKSTLLRAVNGLNPIVQGDVLVNDGSGLVSVPKASRAKLRQLRMKSVAMVFQQFGLLPWRSVRENVGLGLELAGIGARDRRAKIDMQLELVGLTQWADQPVSALSGGMQQRVGLARAFATDAPILLMDEPFSALDPLIRARLQDELLELQDRLKRTIIFVSHDLDEAFKLGNRIAILEGGRMIQCGTPAEIFSNPANAYVADFVANMNPLGVLRARDALVSGPAPASTRSVDIDTPIRAVMEQFGPEDDCLGVTEGARPAGHISRASVMDALTVRRGAR
ncbi:glycine betaine/proline transport system ATP-binding protein [Roseinatronobacter thiooxidans]|uniref:Glycine betaine/proline transport system ATP-binding protein n=1 Tax=Roseinatronobacter thiooxidans TaxID=121821 RepID=A0A2W7QMP6_9RHOB|nr:choline ABC transporter ATP-binding protein [Roseinatronobacter thiooxidans]PZX47340.1 glycine betaine/proline transport system ATP-binding protein [Roseinatronobacter thiooxidans]